MNDLARVMQAADAAARRHVTQRCKGVAQEPYVNHLLEVANLVTAATEGCEADLTIAALLHDAIEDVDIRRDQIAGQFGQQVDGIVMGAWK